MKLSNPISLKEVAGMIGTEFTGDPSMMVTGLNEIHMVQPGDLTFVDHPKYYAKVLRSAATFIIINQKEETPAGKALLFSEDPFRDYVNLVKRYAAFVPAASMVSETAEIGEGTIIQPGAFVGNHVKIGKNCLIHANASIYDHCVIGDNVIIHSGTVIGADAFYFKRRPDFYDKLVSCGRVVLEDNVEVGACCTIDKGVSGDTRIGWGTKLDNHIQIGHDTVVGKNCLMASAVIVGGVTTIEDDVIIWGQVAVQKDLVIGKGAVILAKSGVGKNLDPGKTYFGTPADEAKKKWRELALLKKLPELFENFR